MTAKIRGNSEKRRRTNAAPEGRAAPSASARSRDKSLPRSRGYHHGDLRRALVDEAAKMVAAHGHPTITVRDVARRLGVTNTAAHYHFPTRGELLAAVATGAFEEMSAALAAAMNRTNDAGRRLSALGEAYVHHALRHGRLYQLMFSAETADRASYRELYEVSEMMFALLVDAVRAGQSAGVVRAGSPMDMALVAWCAVHGVTSLALDRRLAMSCFKGRATEELAAVVLRGIGTGITTAG